MAIEQINIIDYMKHLGYKSNDGGICYGIAHMGIQAILSEDIQTFDDHIDKILKDQQSGYKLTDKQRYEQEITPFLEGVEIYFQPALYRDWFEKTKGPTHQDAIMTAPIVASRKIEEQGGLHKSRSFSGIYEENDLTDLFSSLKESVENTKPPSTKPIALELSSADHTISVGYDPIKNDWMFINPSDLPIQHFSSSKELAQAIIDGFSFGEDIEEKILINTTAYTTKNDKAYYEEIIKSWQDSSSWKRLHQVTPEKMRFEDDLKWGWLHSAANIGSLDVVAELLAKKADPNQADSRGNTPLLYAVEAENIEIVEALLRHPKTNPKQATKTGITPLQMAANKPEIRALISQALEKPEPKPSPLVEKEEEGAPDEPIIRLVLKPDPEPQEKQIAKPVPDEGFVLQDAPIIRPPILEFSHLSSEIFEETPKELLARKNQPTQKKKLATLPDSEGVTLNKIKDQLEKEEIAYKEKKDIVKFKTSVNKNAYVENENGETSFKVDRKDLLGDKVNDPKFKQHIFEICLIAVRSAGKDEKFDYTQTNPEALKTLVEECFEKAKLMEDEPVFTIKPVGPKLI